MMSKDSFLSLSVSSMFLKPLQDVKSEPNLPIKVHMTTKTVDPGKGEDRRWISDIFTFPISKGSKVLEHDNTSHDKLLK